MKKEKIRTEDFFKMLGADLEDYGREVTKATKNVVKDAALQCKKDIQERAPVRKGGQQRYKKSWRVRNRYDGPGGIRMIVFAGDEQYRLTHLLENGHVNTLGTGRVKGIPHIAPAADRVRRELPQKLAKAIEEVGE